MPAQAHPSPNPPPHQALPENYWNTVDVQSPPPTNSSPQPPQWANNWNTLTVQNPPPPNPPPQPAEPAYSRETAAAQTFPQMAAGTSAAQDYSPETARQPPVCLSTNVPRPHVSQAPVTNDGRDPFPASSVHTPTGDSSYVCPYGDDICCCNGDIEKHICYYPGRLSYTCMYCEYNSISISGLLRHRKTHAVERPYAYHTHMYC